MPFSKKPLIIQTTIQPGRAGIACLGISGCLDAYTVADFDGEVEARLREGLCRIIVDMTDLKFTSSAGIGALMRLAQQVGQCEGDLVLLNPTDKVLEILELLDFTSIFKMARTLEEATDLIMEECGN